MKLKNLDKTIRSTIRKSLQLEAEEQLSAIFCNHANEVPAKCDCGNDCSCKKTMCKSLNEAYVAQPKVYTQVSEFSSQKTKDAHERLYKSYIEKLNSTSAKIDAAVQNEASADASVYRSLKIDETTLLNGVYLHELFFSNCFDPHSEIFMDSKPYIRLQRDFGTFEDWQKDFMSCAMAAREGWAVTGYNMFLRKFVNTVIDAHANNVQVGLIPVIVLDMWSHSYFRDYIDDKNSYVIAQLRSLNWEIIAERFEKVEAIERFWR